MKLPYSIRAASTDDLAQVAEIESKAIRPPWSESAFQQELQKEYANFWVVTDDETDSIIMAYVVFSFPAEQAHLQTIAVHPDYRRKGLASLLIRKIISYVMKKNGESVILEVRKSNQDAIQLYQNLGFIVIRTIPGFYPDGEDGFVLIFKTERVKIENSNDSEDSSDRRKENLN